MKSRRRIRGAAAILWWAGALAAVSLCGCVVRGPGGYAQVDLVDVQGYHHHGYYDDHHDWHGGYYDEHNGYHDDPHDWHR